MNSSFTQKFQKSVTLHRFSILHVCIKKEMRGKKLAKTKACERGTLLRWSLPPLIQFTVMVSQTHDTLTAAYSWQANQLQSKAIMLLLKSAFTVVQWLSQKCSEMFSLAHDAAEVVFHLHIKANRINTSSTTTQEEKYFENTSACANSAEEFGMLLGIEPASQNWPAELMHATSQVCWKSTSAPSAEVLLPPLQAAAPTLSVLMLLHPHKLYKGLCCLPGSKEGGTCLKA